MPPSLELSGKTIVVDPGHGGHDSGTLDFGYREKDVTLAMGLQLQTTLRGRGAKVVMTRTTDVDLGHTDRADLEGRVLIAQQAQADAFVSIHANSLSNPDILMAVMKVINQRMKNTEELVENSLKVALTQLAADA